MAYYLYYFNNNQWCLLQEFANWDELITFLAYRDASACLSPFNISCRLPWKIYSVNNYLDCINMNGNDIISTFSLNSENSCYSVRPYLFMDEKDHILDMRNYIDEINAKKDYLSKYRYHSDKEFEYRRGPVPGTENSWMHLHLGHNKRYTPKAYRRIKKGAFRKEILNDEYKQFGRACKHKIVSGWELDEKVISRYRSKSWKDKTRLEKQWMKNL